MELVQTVLILAVVTFWLARLEKFANYFIPKPAAQVEAVESDPIPKDLLDLAKQENSEWAQQSVIDAIQEHYRATHDWAKVREAVGLSAGTM